MADEKVSYLEPIEEMEGNSAETLKEKDVEHTPFAVVEAATSSENVTEKSKELQNEALYQKILDTVPETVASLEEDVRTDAAGVSLKTDADSKVVQLVALAEVKGVVHAVKVARALQDFYVLDQMHDDLANRLYDSLKAKGLIEEV